MALRMDVNPIAIGSVAAGLIFVWAGIKGTSVLAAAQSLIQGKQPAADAQTNPIQAPADSSGSGGSSNAPTSAKGGTVAQNQSIAKMLGSSYGWSSGAEWDALVWLWQHESNWSNTAENPSSGAYGIPQALPATKLPKAGRPPKLGGTSDTGAQVSWGLNYIKTRYGSPTKAKAFWLTHNWY